MHLIEKYEGRDMRLVALDKPPFGPGFSKELVEKADRMEWWGSAFNDPAPDYNLFKLYRGEELLVEKRLDGY